MGLLDYSRANPWLGDALATLSSGLLAYGSGNPNAMAQLPLILSQRQQDRRENERQRRIDEQNQKLFDLKLQEQERTANKEREQLNRFNSLIPTLPPELQPVAQATGPGFADMWAKQQVENQFPKDPEAPTIKDFYEGGKIIQKQWNPQTKAWDQVGSGDRWKPESDNGGIQIDTNGDGVPDIVVGGKMKPPTESQSKAANQYTLLNTALSGIEKMMGEGSASSTRSAVADTLGAYGPIGELAGQSLVLTEDDKQYRAKRAAALESLANSITGAAFTEEQKRNFNEMLPRPTDDDATVKAKIADLRAYLAQLQRNAGSALPLPAPGGVDPNLKSKYGLE